MAYTLLQNNMYSHLHCTVELLTCNAVQSVFQSSAFGKSFKCLDRKCSVAVMSGDNSRGGTAWISDVIHISFFVMFPSAQLLKNLDPFTFALHAVSRISSSSSQPTETVDFWDLGNHGSYWVIKHGKVLIIFQPGKNLEKNIFGLLVW